MGQPRCESDPPQSRLQGWVLLDWVVPGPFCLLRFHLQDQEKSIGDLSSAVGRSSVWGWRRSQLCRACPQHALCHLPYKHRLPCPTRAPGAAGGPSPHRAGDGALQRQQWVSGQKVTKPALESATGLSFCHIVVGVFRFLNKKVISRYAAC